MQRAKIVPPFRFGIVESGVYRGAYPTLKNFRHLKTLSLQTIISLIPEPPTQDLEDFCAVNSIELIHYMVEKPKDEVALSVKDIARIVQTIIRPSKLPVFIHCLDGADATGLVICCLRRLQAWHKDAIDNEFLRFSTSGENTVEKLVASFKEVEISEEDLPSWLWSDGDKMLAHPFIKLIKHHQGVVVQVVRPAPKEAKKKETQVQAISKHEALSALKRPRKVTEKRRLEQPQAEREAGSDDDEGGRGAWQLGISPAKDGDGDGEAGATTVSEEEEDEDDDLDGVYPGLLEALSLHNFSDNNKAGRMLPL